MCAGIAVEAKVAGAAYNGILLGEERDGGDHEACREVANGGFYLWREVEDGVFCRKGHDRASRFGHSVAATITKVAVAKITE